MPDVTLFIDGKQVMVPRGTYLIEAARSVGISIPNFCYNPRLRSYGACRLCVVEVEGKRGELITSCSTPVRDGMRIRTDSPRVAEARRALMEMFLVDHPLDCPICDKAGECWLQFYSYEFATRADNPLRKPKQAHRIDHLSPLIDIKRDRCVLCYQCVRVCDELIGSSTLAAVERGAETYIDTPFGQDMLDANCVSCGLCIQVCPVGSLLSRPFAEHAWRLAKVPTVCNYCGVGCNLELNVVDNRVGRTTSTMRLGFNDGLLCAKGYFGWDAISHPQRLRTPLVRKGDTLVETTWEDALSLVAQKFSQSRGSGFALLGSDQLTNEESYLLQKFARAVMGTNNIDSPATRRQGSALRLLSDSLGYPAMTNSLDDIVRGTQCVLVIGDLGASHPVLSYRLQHRVRFQGVNLIVLGFRQTALARRAHYWLKARPGTEAAVVRAMLATVIHLGLVDEAFVRARVHNYDQLLNSLRRVDVERVASISGVPAELIQNAAVAYATGGSLRPPSPERQHPPSAILFNSELSAMAGSEATMAALIDLALVTGNVGREGAGVNPLLDGANELGALDMGMSPHYLPGYVPVGSEAARDILRLWGAYHPLLDVPGLAAPGILAAASRGDISALYVVGDNPLRWAPEARATAEALKAPFLVVQDIYLTETAMLADVVLPASSFAEKLGTYTATDRRVQLVQKAVEGPGLSRPDWWIVLELADRMGTNWELADPVDVLREIRNTVPFYSGVDLDLLTAGELAWPTGDGSDTPILYRDSFPGGKARLLPVEGYFVPVMVDESYPLLLWQGRDIYHLQQSTMLARSDNLARVDAGLTVEVPSRNAALMGIGQGEIVDIVTRYGRATARAVIREDQLEGTLSVPFGYRDMLDSLFPPPQVAPESGTLQYRPLEARLERRS
jgi:predicted molibdopterin-dependent oxidoreductase YjgC